MWCFLRECFACLTLLGVETITMDQTTKKVVVFGNVNPLNVLNRARLDKPESEFWHPRYR